jgi:hypothetical protein
MSTQATKAPAEIVTLTRGLEPDVADVIATQSPELAAELRREGFDGVGVDYAIGDFFGDREAAEALLGRAFTREETTALEGCIRYYLDESEPGAF